MSNYSTVNKPQRMQLKASPAPYFILWALSILLQSAQSVPQVPCYFVFGDSLSDNGNNNDLQTSAKVNYPPYGIDYPGQRPTGRFSNGRNIVDVIAGHMGFEDSVPPFASIATMNQEIILNYASGSAGYDEAGHLGFEESISPFASIATMNQQIILKGVNYASGSAGIRQETGQHLGVRIPLHQQLVNHQLVVSRIWSLLGNESSCYLKRCLYMINIGSNDYLNNYFVPENYSTSQDYTPEQYAQELIQQYSQQIQKLYGMGARKVALFGVGELGLIPQAISKCGSLGIVCSTKMSIASELFNKHLRELVDELNLNRTDANFTCINMDVIYPTSSIGFEHLRKACCKVRSDGQCEEGSSTQCQDRDKYVFFDNFHPTEAMNKRIGGRAYRAFTELDAHPIDIRTLVQT